jgi:hypothetical protein
MSVAWCWAESGGIPPDFFRLHQKIICAPGFFGFNLTAPTK